MRAQNDLRRFAALGDLAACLAETGGLSVPPVWALYEARPLAFSPPLGFLPSFLVHAAVLGIILFFSFFSLFWVHNSGHACCLCFSCLSLYSRPSMDLV